MSGAERTWSEIVDRLRSGDDVASSEFYARYGPLLEKVASAHLEARMLRRVEPDEVAHSVCRTFLRRVQGGGFALAERGDLWRLLCAITVAKARKKARHHLAQKRGVARERALDDATVDAAALELADAAPTPEEAAEYVDTFRHLLDRLDAEEQRIVGLKLDQRTNDEIAKELGCSERTVRRITSRIEARLAAVLEAG